MTDSLQELQRRLAVVRDRVRGVARRHYTGFYLFGRAGTAKTYTVRTTLDELNIPYEYHAGHLTPMGLFDSLRISMTASSCSTMFPRSLQTGSPCKSF